MPLIPLLDDEDNLTKETVQTLRTIFDRYSKGKDALSRQGIDDFATATNGEPFSAEEMEELELYFDTNEKGELTWKGFQEMYQLQSLSEEHVTRSDLVKNGFPQFASLEE